MSAINDHKQEINQQFISIHEAIHLVAQTEDCDPITTTKWLLSQDHILRRQRYLQCPDDFTLQDYEPCDNDTGEYIEPYINATALIQKAYVNNQNDAINEITQFNLGFARQNLLHSLDSVGIKIPREILSATKSYIPKESTIDDCSSDYIHLVQQLKIIEKENLELRTQQNQINNPSINHLHTIQDCQQCQAQQAELKALQTENNVLKQRIAVLEAQTAKHPEQELMHPVLNTAHPRHAPDLAHSLNLWNDLYGTASDTKDSHSNRANIWIGKNTGYADSQTGGSQAIARVREITTPFTEWGGQRNKNHKKN